MHALRARRDYKSRSASNTEYKKNILFFTVNLQTSNTTKKNLDKKTSTVENGDCICTLVITVQNLRVVLKLSVNFLGLQKQTRTVLAAVYELGGYPWSQGTLKHSQCHIF